MFVVGLGNSDSSWPLNRIANGKTVGSPLRAHHLEVRSFRVVVSPARLERAMLIGERLKALREQKDMSQGDIEKSTGLLRCYISRSKTDTQFPLWILWKRWPALWKFLPIGFSPMMST